MFLRHTQTTTRGRRYDYIHLVESYRRPDGRPAHRVLANVTDWDEQALKNLEAALEASRTGKRVIVAPKAPSRHASVQKITANLRYLDIAVFLKLCKQWQLDELLAQCLDGARGDRLAADLVVALVMQRCVQPSSKLAAARWFPHTALPHLLGVDPKQFNNTRIHRVLHDLEQATPMVMAKLPALYRDRDGAFASLFMDVTDTWFEGAGPPIAQRAKTKDGVSRQKINIVLLCNEQGYPLRWHVVPGKTNDSRSMTDLFQSISGLPWAIDTPIVADRSLGNTAHLQALQQTGLHFVTALVKTEFPNYAPALPYRQFTDLDVDHKDPAIVQKVAHRIEQAGFHRVSDTLFYADLGIVTTDDDAASSDEALQQTASLTEDRTVHAMRLCRHMVQMVADQKAGSLTHAATLMGLGRSGVVSKYLKLRHLSQHIQQAILEGKASGRTLLEIGKIASLASDAQQEAFDALLQQPTVSPPDMVNAGVKPSRPQKPLAVRVVAYFNPERFVEQRVHARQKLQNVFHGVRSLNTALASARSRRKRDDVIALIDQQLRRIDLVSAFDVVIDETHMAGRQRLQVRLTLNADNWAKRRQSDGFVVLVAHPDVGQSAQQLCRLYRAKDTIEKDFLVIKSVLDVRPIRHRSDEKVRAHVTLCMLALLLDRTLRDHLKGTYTTEQAKELLDVRLNAYKTPAHRPPVYSLTELSAPQRALLRRLHASHLADDNYIAEQIARTRT